MPAIQLHTVGVNGLLRDYILFTTWEAAQQRNLVTADEIEHVECYNDGIMSDNLILDDWTTDETRYIKIYTPLSERHTGQPYTGFRLSHGSGIGFNIKDGNVWVDGISFDGSGRGIYAHITANPGWFNVSACFKRGGLHGIDFLPSSGLPDTLTGYFWNNIFTNCTYGVYYAGTTDLVYAYSNSVYGCNYGFYTYYADLFVAKNCVVVDCVTADFYLAADFHADSEYNASSAGAGDTDKAPGANSIYSIVADDNFTDLSPGVENLHIKDTGAGIYQTGVNLSADPDLAFGDDVDGEARGVMWDMGADMYSLIPPDPPPAASETVHTIGTDGGLRDYILFTTWEAAQQRNLTTGDGETEVAECYNDGVMSDHFYLDDWITNTRCYIKIYTPGSERHNGTLGTGFRIYGGSFTPFFVKDGNVLIEGISIETLSTWAISIDIAANPGWMKVSHNLIEGGINYYTWSKLSQPNPVVYSLWNNFVLSNSYGIYCTELSRINYVYSNSVYGGTRGIYPFYADLLVAKNNVVAGTSLGDFYSVANFHSDSDYNASEDTLVSGYGAPGAHSIRGIIPADNFMDLTPDDEDLHIKDESADIFQTGVNLSDEPDLSFDDDIDGQTRGVTWDIGADYLVIPIPPGTIVFEWTFPDDENLYVQCYTAVHLAGQSDSKDTWSLCGTVKSTEKQYQYNPGLPTGIVIYTKVRVIDKFGRVSPFSDVRAVTIV